MVKHDQTCPWTELVNQPVLPRQRLKDKVSQSKHLQYPSADKQVIATFVLLVLLSFSVLHEIDQALKGRLKWYEKSTKRKVNYQRSFETGSSKVELLRSPEWKFLNSNAMNPK